MAGPFRFLGKNQLILQNESRKGRRAHLRSWADFKLLTPFGGVIPMSTLDSRKGMKLVLGCSHQAAHGPGQALTLGLRADGNGVFILSQTSS